MDNFKQVTQLHSIGKHAVCFVDDDNYIYYKLRIRNLNQVQKLQCIHCNAKGTLELLKLYIAVEHDHDANISEAEIRRFKHRLRLHAIEDKVSFDEAYGIELIRMPSEVVLPTQSSMCANFYRIRNQQRPPIPVTAVEAIERAMSERYYVRKQRFFQIHTNVRGKYSLIFLSPGLLSARLQASDTVFLDGTFKIVPPMFTQLISIHFKFIDEIFPAVYILMQDKSTASYVEALTQLKTLLPQFNPNIMKSDFETGLTVAFKQVFPNCQLSGCWFHYTQCIWRRLGQSNMQRLYRHDMQVTSIVKMIMAIPLLPADKMIEAKNIVLTEIDEFQDGQNKDNLLSLLNYFNDFWISTAEKRAQLSVFKNRDRTNNIVEGFHSILIKRFHAHPNFYKFLEKLISVEGINHCRLTRYSANFESWKPPRKNKWKRQLSASHCLNLPCSLQQTTFPSSVQMASTTTKSFPDNWHSFSRKEKHKYKRKLWNESKRYEKRARYIECPLNNKVTAHEQDNSLMVSLPTVESTTRPMPENRIMLTRKEKRELKKIEYNKRKNEIRQEDFLYRPVNLNSIPLPTTGGQVTGSPFKYDVDSISCGYVTAHGPGLMDGITGEPCNFTIATNNAPSAVMSLSVKGPNNKPKISCIDNKDGTVSVNYLPTAPGEYKVAVKFAEKHISGSPYSVKITDRWRKKDE